MRGGSVLAKLSRPVMAKHGSELFKFLSRHRDKEVRIAFTRAETRALSRLSR